MTCPICVSSESTLSEKGSNFEYLECTQCGLIYCHGMQAGDEQFYNGHEVYRYSSESEAFAQKEFFVGTPFFKREICKLAPGSKILDIGCGYGGFVSMASDLGFDATGIDFNGVQIEIGRAAFALAEDKLLHADVSTLLNLKSDGRFFDCICLFEVIEHVDNPDHLIDMMLSLLAPNGTLLIPCPNEDRLQPTGRVFVDYPPHHLTRWKPATLENYLNKKGLKLTSKDFDFDLLDFVWVPLINFQSRRRERKVATEVKDLVDNRTHKRVSRKRLYIFIKSFSKFISLPGKYLGLGTMGARYSFRRKL